MKTHIYLTLALCLTTSFVQAAIRAAAPGEKLEGYRAQWAAQKHLENPESAYYSPEEKALYVSNVAGDGTKKDGKGWVQKLSLDGKIIKAKLLDGLNAPKGLRAKAGTLWVADIDEIIAADTKTGEIKSRIKIDGARLLNDIAITSENVVYVSDTLGDAIYRITGNKAEVFAKGTFLEGPNGLLVRGGKLIVAAWGTEVKSDWSTTKLGHLYALDLKTKNKKVITKKRLGNLDGIEMDHRGQFLVSDWKAGKVYRVTTKGQVTELLNGFKGAADLGFIPQSKTLLVPRMGENLVDAYDLASYPNY